MNHRDVIDAEYTPLEASAPPDECMALATRINDAIPLEYRTQQDTSNLMRGAAQGNMEWLREMQRHVEGTYGVTIYTAPVTNNYYISIDNSDRSVHTDNRNYSRRKSSQTTAQGGDMSTTWALAFTFLFVLLVAGMGGGSK